MVVVVVVVVVVVIVVHVHVVVVAAAVVGYVHILMCVTAIITTLLVYYDTKVANEGNPTQIPLFLLRSTKYIHKQYVVSTQQRGFSS